MLKNAIHIQQDLLATTASHLYLLPHPALRNYIAHYVLHLPIAAIPYASLLIPDASGSIACIFNDTNTQIYLLGPSSQVVTVPTTSTADLCFFVDFRPTGMHSLMSGLPVCKIKNKSLPLFTADKQLCSELTLAFEQTMLLSKLPSHLYLSISKVASEVIPDLATFVQKIDAIFLQQLSKLKTATAASEIVRQMLNPHGTIGIQNLSNIFGCSARHFNRLCTQQVGLSAKSFARTIRINRACEHLKQNNTSMAWIAHQLGYYDHAHFCHDFKEICGVSPSNYLHSTSAFYSEPHKLIPIP